MLAERPAPVRLRGPSSANGTGRVEIFHDGRWGTICTDQWDIYDARVACRQLGYEDAGRALSGSYVPDGTGPIWLDNLTCTGNEKTLDNCTHRGWGVHNCSHWGDAGVECSAKGRFMQSKNLYTGCIKKN